MKLRGVFRVVHKDKNGRIKGKYTVKNGVVNIGKNRILDVMFHGTAASDPWYIGLINGPAPSLSATDTMGAHAGWTENDNYAEANRQTWDENAAASQEITTANAAVFSIDTDTQQIAGLFIVDDNTKLGAGGLLWSTGLFDSVLNLDNGDTLNVEYELAVS